MSEKLMRTFKLNEIATVRLVCKHPGCGAVTEVTLDRLEKCFQDGRCKVCSAPFNVVEMGVPFTNPRHMMSWLCEFAKCVEVLTKSDVMVDLEFAVPIQELCKLDRLQ
ncbi:MAG TPA: hypothetical protein VH592_15355 [Gemmataceae bacterium]